MCRSEKEGGRRCSCGTSYAAAARANGNRRVWRQARRKVAALLQVRGLERTAAQLQKASPGVLPEFMRELGIPRAALEGLELPSSGSEKGRARAVALAAAARAELAALREGAAAGAAAEEGE